ncbi:MAG: hypothetical protein CM15mP89_4850 [Gammaproteobacteria bacterium]|nr:MAG: hypothetical protein CM15mP89_4850 [Gammaproteobacteria bacterium]
MKSEAGAGRQDFTQQTSGLAPGYVQCNIVILPAGDAAHFESFCTLNPKPCPLLAVSERPGIPHCPGWEPTSIFEPTCPSIASGMTAC